MQNRSRLGERQERNIHQEADNPVTDDQSFFLRIEKSQNIPFQSDSFLEQKNSQPEASRHRCTKLPSNFYELISLLSAPLNKVNISTGNQPQRSLATTKSTWGLHI
jgi:hypothetical protein